MPSVTQELHPWKVPRFVRVVVPPGKRQDGFKESPAIPISELPPETLAAMCDQFRADVFREAGLFDPWVAGGGKSE